MACQNSPKCDHYVTYLLPILLSGVSSVRQYSQVTEGLIFVELQIRGGKMNNLEIIFLFLIVKKYVITSH